MCTLQANEHVKYLLRIYCVPRTQDHKSETKKVYYEDTVLKVLLVYSERKEVVTTWNLFFDK